MHFTDMLRMWKFNFHLCWNSTNPSIVLGLTQSEILLLSTGTEYFHLESSGQHKMFFYNLKDFQKLIQSHSDHLKWQTLRWLIANIKNTRNAYRCLRKTFELHLFFLGTVIKIWPLMIYEKDTWWRYKLTRELGFHTFWPRLWCVQKALTEDKLV